MLGPEYLTTKEVAAYLRLKERRIYELVRRRAIPCTRVSGKWLFPRALIDLWLARNLAGSEATAAAPAVIAGSHDPLLDWALGEAGAGLAQLPGGSLDGLARFAEGEAMICGLHVYDPESNEFNRHLLEETFKTAGVVLIQWAWREQGLLVPKGNPLGIKSLRHFAAAPLRLARRQAAAGSHILLLHLIGKARLKPQALTWSEEAARSETEAGMAVLEGRADAAFAIAGVARSLGLDFLPLFKERFDLLIRRRDYFEAPMQRLLEFARSREFAARAHQLGGYNVANLGRVEWNAP